ncbi:hypothetical protein PIB30_062903 [Stylosanthes scabra]|uniref:Uncharacterized protein n=1 Tax=Stylosanthes scabra TaxID=79078 RepID=A0ABU6QKQ7_9FABA|nr:hypothetical protein [Stylosanthes scabra]
MLVHEPTSRFRPALRLPRRSCAKSAAFEASRVHAGLTPVHLGDPVQWVNQPMIHLVNRRFATKASVAKGGPKFSKNFANSKLMAQA